VLIESKSLIHGVWPAFTCQAELGEGFFSRVAYTWHGLLWGSFIFYMFFLSVYNVSVCRHFWLHASCFLFACSRFLQILGRSGASSFSDFVDVPYHVFTTRVSTWVIILFTPLMAMAFDVTAKVFSNMFYPTQTQIHMEIECNQRLDKRRFDRERARRER
jgi:hypothetical protein